MHRKSAILLCLILLGLSACDRDGVRVSPDAVARAGDIELQVEQAAQILAPVQGLPNDPPVVEALADFWVDYTLLAMAVNGEEGLDQIDLSSLMEQEENQELVARLRDEVIDVDEEVSDEELEEIYETERPGERVRARHILLLHPDDATQAQRDSLRTLAEELRDRARAGEDFSAMAEEYSDDTGSAARGGDLNWFSRGTMVPPFEAAAFALEPGEVSEVVESQHGLHIIKLDEREFPALEDMREQLRFDIQTERTQQAESIFIAGLETEAGMQVTDDAFEAVREIAGNPGQSLSGSEADRALVSFEGGAFTRAQFRNFVRLQPAEFQQQIAAAEDEQLDTFLRNLTRSELLVLEARRRGVTVDPSEMDTLRNDIHDQYREVATFLEIDAIEPDEGESLQQAVEREMLALLERIVNGESDVFPLDTLAGPLRDHFGAAVSEAGIERVIDRVVEIREENPDLQGGELEGPGPLSDDSVPPDTTG